jgi:O-antigen ligase
LTEQDRRTTEETKEYMAATGSAEARFRLLKDSITITLNHPIFGVGPGNFMVEQENLAVARGELGMWHVTHNSYTQVSSEMGIPGLVLYVAFLYQTFKVLNSIVRNRQGGERWADLRALGSSLRGAIIVLATIAFFDSFAYLPDVPILAGLASALGYLAQKQRAADRTASAQSTVPPPLPEPESVLEPAWAGPF